LNKKKKMKKTLSISLLLLGIGVAQAQEKSQALYFNIGSGFHNLKYDLANGKQEGNIGMEYNVGYNYFFSNKWGIGTGLGLETFQSKATLNYQTGNSSVDTDGESFEFRTQYSDWQEQQNSIFLNIPVNFIYQLHMCNKWKIQFSMGPQILFLLKSNYKIAGGAIETTGYYSQYNVILHDLPQHNFTTTTELPKGKNSLNPGLSAIVNLGGLYQLNQNMDIYLGAYFDYGLTNTMDTKSKFLYQEDGVYNGVFSSDQTKKVKPIAFGFKIGISWNQ
jgi:hypothetical protein